MRGIRDWRAWSPIAALTVLAGAWYVANLAGYAQTLDTERAANVKVLAIGHPPVFTNLPSMWQLQPYLRPPLFGIVGAAMIALVVRRTSARPWFLLVAALPVIVGHSAHLHGWWAPGPGIDDWTFGAGVVVPGLDLSTFRAGPSWAISAGTLLAVAAVLAPALLARPLPDPRPRLSRMAHAVPYLVLLGVATALVVGELNIDDSGGGSAHNMLVGGTSALLIGLLVSWGASAGHYWRDVIATAAAVGLVTVSGLNPSAMSRTKVEAFVAAAGIAIVSAAVARLRSGSHHRFVRRLQRGGHDVGDVAHQPNL